MSANLLRKLGKNLRNMIQPKHPAEWRKIEYFDTLWKQRIEGMATHIQANQSVLDLGCGLCWLKEYLPENCTYIPVDYTSRCDGTIISDFNKNQFPDINTDVAFVSGCLEYISEPHWFIQKIATHSQKCILSFCTLDFFSAMDERLKRAWKCHFSEEELITTFRRFGFKLTDKSIHNNPVFVFVK